MPVISVYGSQRRLSHSVPGCTGEPPPTLRSPGTTRNQRHTSQLAMISISLAEDISIHYRSNNITSVVYTGLRKTFDRSINSWFDIKLIVYTPYTPAYWNCCFCSDFLCCTKHRNNKNHFLCCTKHRNNKNHLT